MACDDAVGWMHSCFAKLLHLTTSVNANRLIGTHKDIKEMTVDLKNLREMSVFGNSKKPRMTVLGEIQVECPHKVLRVTMLDNTPYVVDIAGAQFGFHSPVSRWELFTSGRVRHISKTFDFGTSKKSLMNPREEF